MSKSKLKARLRALPVKARKELLPGFDDEEFEALLEKEDHEILRLIKEKDRSPNSVTAPPTRPYSAISGRETSNPATPRIITTA